MMDAIKCIASFQNGKSHLHHSPVVLGNFGFEYNRTTALIQCCLCSFDVTESKLEIMEILAGHGKYAPKCPLGKADICSKDLQVSLNNARGAIRKVLDYGVNGEKLSSAFVIGIGHLTDRVSRNKDDSQKQITGTTCGIDDVDSANLKMNRADTLVSPVKTVEIDTTFLIKFSKHPIMSCTEERRESFKGQEQKYKHCERANIEDFVTAGLFYVGPEDNVRCFFCDGGLRNVQSHNNPFLEHKRWFPNCKFVIYLEEQGVTGPGTVNSRLQKDHHGESTTDNLFGNVSNLSLKIPGRALEAREVKARLETPMVQELMKQGFQREYLKRAIERRFILCGDDFGSAHELVKDILDVEGDKALPRPGQANNSSQATSDQIDGAAAAAAVVVRTAVSCTGKKLLGKGKDLLAAELEIAVSDEVKNMKTSDVLHTLKTTAITDSELRRLWDVYQELSQVRTCKICLDREINTVFLPCGHYVTCDKCCPKISHCCICRALIRGTVLALSATCEIK